MNPQEQFWAGQEGDQYHARHADPDIGSVKSNIALFQEIFENRHKSLFPDVNTVIEFGAGTGLNLRALQCIGLAQQNLTAVEINQNAAAHLIGLGFNVLFSPMLNLNVNKIRHDLAFTKGLLIHVAPDDLPEAYQLLYNASRKYVLVCEYFSPTPRMIPYHGQNDRLWARDFAGEMLDTYKDLQLVDYGFVSRRDQHPQDDITWMLMEKT